MKRNERFIEIMKHCVDGNGCDDCPHIGAESCVRLLMADAIERLEKQSAPTTTLNYEAQCRRFEEELCRVNVEYERTQHDLAEAQKELTYLRGIKATAEAFLGAKIDGQM